MKIAPYRALHPDTKLIASADSFFDAVKYEYPQYVKNGFFKKTSQEAFYLYQIKRNGQRHLGLLCCVDIQDYRTGHIKVHEHTLAAKEQKTTELMLDRKAMIKPVLLSHERNEDLIALFEEIKETHSKFYKITLTEDNIQHKVWRVTDGDMMERLRKLYSSIDHVYIADGHHRIATTSHLYELQREGSNASGLDFQWLHSALFSFDQLEIHDYNRVVSVLEDLTGTQLMARLSRYFHITELPAPQKPLRKHLLTMMLKKEWYQLEWKQEILDQHHDVEVLLDAALFDKYVLTEIVGIKNVKEDSRVDYVQGPKGLEGLRDKVLKSEFNVGFCLPPVQVQEFVDVSDAQKTLPPKSTWFEPRLKNGFIVQSLK